MFIFQAAVQAQDWAAAAAGTGVQPVTKLSLDPEILEASFKFWREALLYAIGFFILGLLLGKAGF